MNILIRADSSSTIGTGHIMRDLALAKHYPNDILYFATQNLQGNINHKILEAHHHLITLQTNELKELSHTIEKYNIQMIIIDSYQIDHIFEKQLQDNHPHLKIMVLDDIYEKHSCDILLNHNIYAKKEKYANLVPQNCEIRCGKEFTLIRDEFVTIKKEKQQQNDYILIAMGGSDPQNYSSKIIETLNTNLKIDVVTTDSNPNLELLKTIKNITLHINSNRVAELLYNAKLIICSPSVICHEVLFLEKEFIAIETAQNQKLMSEYLKQNKYNILENFDTKKLQTLVTTILGY